jgi:hypothetical protein
MKVETDVVLKWWSDKDKELGFNIQVLHHEHQPSSVSLLTASTRYTDLDRDRTKALKTFASPGSGTLIAEKIDADSLQRIDRPFRILMFLSVVQLSEKSFHELRILIF